MSPFNGWAILYQIKLRAVAPRQASNYSPLEIAMHLDTLGTARSLVFTFDLRSSARTVTNRHKHTPL